MVKEPALVPMARKVAIVLVVAAWLALLAGFAGRWWWVLDLFSHFRLQYAVALGVLAMVLSVLRRHWLAIFAFAGSFAATVSIVNYTGWQTKPALAATGEFRFATFNAFYLNEDVARIGSGLESIAADAVALQEMDASRARELAKHLPSYKYAYFDAAHRYGAVIFSRWPIARGATIELVPEGARAAKVTLDWRGKPVTVIGTHLHWPLGPHNAGLRNAELQQLAQLVTTIKEPLMVGGDFNITPWSLVFQDALASSGLKDCARGRGLTPTWPTFFSPLSIRIDHCLVSKDWEVVGVRTAPSLGSDHYPAVNDLTLRVALSKNY